ncbi:putative transcription elongation factor S-II [Schistocerca gregaria]|uniref:putative transcription elongation factor S-II n=1 Tax=Schistocerca gregaria TaxID=7010 RepID=UPI00211EB3C7|nr:putative transcription elongation factor S-II [Schistocerca gregaria]
MIESVLRVKSVLQDFIREPTKDYDLVMENLLILERLDMSLSVLQETEIGKVITRLKRYVKEHQSASELISRLLLLWKQTALRQLSQQTQIIDAESHSVPNKRYKTEGKTDILNNELRPAKNFCDSSCEAMASSNDKLQENRNPLVDKYEYTVPANNKRRTLFNNLFMTLKTQSLLPHLHDSEIFCHNLAIVIEEAVYNRYKDMDEYIDQLQSIRFNLSQNKKLLNDICTGVLAIQKLATMSSEELATEEVRKKRETIIEESTAARQQPKLEANCSTEPCLKCGSNKVHVTQAQTRSADEPMTQFFTCTKCSKKWKK